MTTHPTITRLRELSEKATPAPWREKSIRFSLLESNGEDNDNFIAQSRNALPVLLDCLEDALTTLTELKESPYVSYGIQCTAGNCANKITAKLDALKGEGDG